MKITRQIAKNIIATTPRKDIEESIGKGNYESFVHWANGGRCEYYDRTGRWLPTFDPDSPEWAPMNEYRPAPVTHTGDFAALEKKLTDLINGKMGNVGKDIRMLTERTNILARHVDDVELRLSEGERLVKKPTKKGAKK